MYMRFYPPYLNQPFPQQFVQTQQPMIQMSSFSISNPSQSRAFFPYQSNFQNFHYYSTPQFNIQQNGYSNNNQIEFFPINDEIIGKYKTAVEAPPTKTPAKFKSYTGKLHSFTFGSHIINMPHVLLHEGNAYVFHYQKSHTSLFYYRCYNHNKDNYGVRCNVRILVDENLQFIEYSNNLIHLEKCSIENFTRKSKSKEILEMIEMIKELALDRSRTPDNIINKVLQMYEKRSKATQSIISITPSYIKNIVHKTRQEKQITIDPLSSIIKINGRKWIQLNSSFPDIVIFQTKEQIEELSLCSVILIDGTFWATPPPYYQILNFMGCRNATQPKYIPLGHILLCDKKCETYYFAIKQLLIMLPKLLLHLKTILIDWEEGLWAALEQMDSLLKRFTEHCSEVNIKGCNFHFCQAIYRFFKQNCPHDENEKNQKKLLYFFLTFPYINSSFIYDFMQQMSKREHKCDFLFDYFQAFWMPKISKWNIADDLINEITTTNALESYHHQLRIKLVHSHMDILSFSHYLYELDNEVWLKKKLEAPRLNRSEPLAKIRAEASKARMLNFINEFPLKEQQECPKKRGRPKSHNAQGVNPNSSEITNEKTDTITIWTFQDQFFNLADKNDEEFERALSEWII